MPPEVKKALDDTEDILNIVCSKRTNIIPNWNFRPILKVGKIFNIHDQGIYSMFVGNAGSYSLYCKENLFLPTKTCFKLADDLLLLAKYYEDKR